MSRTAFGTIFVAIFFLSINGIAQSGEKPVEPNADVQNLDLEDLLNMKMTVATKKALSASEIPGIVTAVSSEEIRNSGARDLADILTTFVPGFQISTDVEMAVGPAIRGIYSIEGKVLLLIDGIEANDDVWGNVLFQNHYPADLIDHVEVIRGPGSAIYGNYASLGVISVTTKGAVRNTFQAHALDSQMAKAPDHQDFVLGYSKDHSSDFSSSVFLTKGDGSRTDSKYPTYFYSPQNTYPDWDGADKLNARPEMLDADIKYKGLDFRMIIDLFSQKYPQQAEPELNALDMEYSYLFDLRYEYKVSDTLKITPRYSYNLHKPYMLEVTGLDPAQNYGSDVSENHRDSKRYFYGILSQWDPNKKLSVVSGVEYYKTVIYIGDGWYYKTNSQNGSNTPQSFANFGGSNYANENTAIYAQGTLQTDFANLTAGARYERTWRFGDAFVPRIGLTKTIDKFHTKAMVTQSFRTPLGIQIDKTSPSTPLKPEKALNTEIEAGYRLSPEMLVQANIFDIELKDCLIYQSALNGGNSTYANVNNQRTQGLEAEFRYLDKNKSLTANYAYYQSLSHPIADDVPADHSFNVGLPKNRINVIGGYRFNEKLSIHPIWQYFSKNYSWVWTDGTGATPPTMAELEPVMYFHLTMRLRDLYTKGLDLEFGGHNIFNQTGFLPQAYAGGVNAQPIDSRSAMVRLSYTKEI